MVTYDTEEEQVEAIKKWWKENGRSVIAGLVIGISAVLGWNGWQSYKTGQARAASDLFQQLLQASDKGQSDSVLKLVQKINESYSSTPYATYSNLFLVREKVNAGDIEAAQNALAKVVESPSDKTIKHIALLRLLQLMYARGEYDAALEAIGKVNLGQSGAFESQYQEMKGDIYVALKRDSEARIAYRRATTLGRKSKFLDLKMDDLAVSTSEE